MKIFVSGTYDILHAGHVQFFKEARALGDYLIVSFCSNENLKLYKGRESCIPDDNKKILLESIRYVDKVVVGDKDGGVWDFVPAFLSEKPDMLVTTIDDKHAEEKRVFCEKHKTKFVVLPKTPPMATPTCTSGIIKKILEKRITTL
jgi:cytidyltransferase-like protein